MSFINIKTPQMTVNIETDVENLFLINGKIKIYEHVKAVAETNMKPAERF